MVRVPFILGNRQPHMETLQVLLAEKPEGKREAGENPARSRHCNRGASTMQTCIHWPLAGKGGGGAKLRR
jgi:hypothetical protein